MGSRYSQLLDNPQYSRPGDNDEESAGVPWKMDTVQNTIPDVKHWRGAQPCELQHPALKHCRQTRMLRDQCITSNGYCDYKIEAHFQCLEQYFPKEKVDRLRSVFRSPAYDNYQVIDNLMARAPFYYFGDFAARFQSVDTRW
eukprot:TRINITY_DN27080_c0_g1_i1.p1 TRINITY_DN27080_c0_g1~~TRINITY_DN27080_c0_g1_i1.p1  ORF type:complete len:142 (+),score=47.55 TRINITY_DN27080_c0_g1_i1:79-504(+)